MDSLVLDTKDKFLLNFEGQDFSHENKEYIRVRESAIESLKKLSFPTMKDEDWKYTSTRQIVNGNYRPLSFVNVRSIDDFIIPGLEANLLVFINGFYSKEFSKVQEVDKEKMIVCPVSEAKAEYSELMDGVYGQLAKRDDNVFVALNTAYSQDGGFVYIAENADIERPVHIVNISDGEEVAAVPRNLMIASKGSRAKVVMSYHSIDGATSFSNVVTEVLVKRNANLTIDKLQIENLDAQTISTEQVYQEADSTFTINTISLGGGMVRNNLNIVPGAKNCTTNLNGLYMPSRRQHIDNHTLVDHVEPHCNSNELYKGVMSGKSTGVFNGKVYVRQDAQKTLAFQSNANILLSDDATINSKPELEIYADDVKCSHGSTTGQFDEDAVFYLRARGIGELSARALLVEAFAGEVLEKIELEPVRELCMQLIRNKFEEIKADESNS